LDVRRTDRQTLGMTRSRSFLDGLDHQQRDDLAIRPLILADAEVGQLDKLLAAQPTSRNVSTIAHCQNASRSSCDSLTSFPRCG
jgi:hypothetical protein